MTLLKFTQKMYLLFNVKPLDDLKVQILWLNMCPTSWSISTRNLWWVKWLVMFNLWWVKWLVMFDFCLCYFRFLRFVDHCSCGHSNLFANVNQCR